MSSKDIKRSAALDASLQQSDDNNNSHEQPIQQQQLLLVCSICNNVSFRDGGVG